MPKGRKLNNAHDANWLTLFIRSLNRERGVNQGALWQPVKLLAVRKLTPGIPRVSCRVFEREIFTEVPVFGRRHLHGMAVHKDESRARDAS
jgi:hypothetical protein